MTPERLLELVKSWRARANADVKHGLKHALDSDREYYGTVNAGFEAAQCADELEALVRGAVPPAPQVIATVDGRCGCNRCRERTENIYRMVGVCVNCGAKPILMLFREGDPAAPQDCPMCGGSHTVRSLRLATPDEIPAASQGPAPRGKP